jgi:hypothetical protein
MNDHRKLRPLGTIFCRQYQTQAHFFVEPAEPNNIRHLVVQYENGRKEFCAGISGQWTDTELLNLLRNPGWEGMSYPVWEYSARYFANPMLMWPPVVSCHVPVRPVVVQAQNQAAQGRDTPSLDEAATKQGR